MANAGISISVVGYDEWRKLSKKLRGAPNELRANLRKQIQAAGKPILEDVKEAARTIPVTSSGGGGTARRQTFNSMQAGRRAHETGKSVESAAKRAAGRRKAGLRRSVANAAKLQIRARGIRFIIDSSTLPESQRTLPRHLDSPKGWRHPVFGNRENWVHQEGKPYFASTIKKRSNDFRKAILDAMEETKNKIQN